MTQFSIVFPSFLPPSVGQLTELESIACASQIQRKELQPSLIDRPIATSYIRQGRGGVPIVCLHGFDSSLLEFRRIMPIIAQQREVWAIDLLGFGFTDRLPECKFSNDSIRAHLYAVWQQLIQQPIILVGVSMGGAAAIEFTLNYPDAVRQLILIDSAGFTSPPAMGKFFIQPLGNLATKFLSSPQVRRNVSEKAYYDRQFVTDDSLTCAALHLEMPRWREALIEFTRSGGYGYLLDRLSEIDRETLIIWGREDRILGTKAANLFQQKLPNSRLEWLEDCGHVPHLEKAAATADLILEFARSSIDSP